MPNWEAYREAYNRGILPDDKMASYEEAINRGLVPQEFVPDKFGAQPQEQPQPIQESPMAEERAQEPVTAEIQPLEQQVAEQPVADKRKITNNPYSFQPKERQEPEPKEPEPQEQEVENLTIKDFNPAMLSPEYAIANTSKQVDTMPDVKAPNEVSARILGVQDIQDREPIEKTRDFWGTLSAHASTFPNMMASGIAGTALRESVTSPQDVANERQAENEAMLQAQAMLASRGIGEYPERAKEWKPRGYKPSQQANPEVSDADVIEAIKRNQESKVIDWASKVLTKQRNEISRKLENVEVTELTLGTMTDPSVLGRLIGSTAPYTMFALGSALITKKPSVGISLGSAMTYVTEGGNMFADAVQAGVPIDQARKMSQSVATINALLEAVPAYTAIRSAGLTGVANKAIAQAMMRRGLFDAGKKISKDVLVNGTADSVTEVLQELNNIVQDMSVRDVPEDEIVKRLAEAGYGSLLVGAGTGTGAGMYSLVSDAVNVKHDLFNLLMTDEKMKRESVRKALTEIEGVQPTEGEVRKAQFEVEMQNRAERESLLPQDNVERFAPVSQKPQEQQAQDASDVGETVGAKNLDTEAIREARGLDVIEDPRGRFGEEVRQSAIEGGLVDRAEDIAQRVLTGTEEGTVEGLATDAEQYAMAERLARLDDEYSRAVEQARSAPELAGRADELLNSIDLLTGGLKKSGTNLSNAFNARRLNIKRDTYELANVVQRAEKLAKKKLPQDRVEVYNKLVSKLKKLNAELDALESSGARPEEILMKKAEVRGAKRRIDDEVYSDRKFDKKRLLKEYTNAFRVMMATADMSYMFRQALIPTFGHPVIASKSAMNAIKSTFSSMYFDKTMTQIEEDPMYPVAKKYGLAFTDLGGLTPSEELFSNNMLERFKTTGWLVRGSERNMTAGLNSMRMELFKDFTRKHQDVSAEVLEAYAKYLNAATGRGNLDGRTAENLSYLFFAPRFAVSRVEAPLRAVDLLKHKETRGEIARQWGALASTAGTVLALAQANGLEVGTDPDSPDWGKIVIGDSRIDMFAGMQQPLRLIARGVKAGYKRSNNEVSNFDMIEAFADYGKYKLNPSITLPMELLTGRDVIGKEISPVNSFLSRTKPLNIGTAMDALENKNTSPEEAIALFVLESIGFGVQTYEQSGRKSRRVAF